MAKFTFTLSIGYQNKHVEEYEIDDEDLQGLDDEKREAYVHKEWTEWAWQFIDGSCEEVTP